MWGMYMIGAYCTFNSENIMRERVKLKNTTIKTVKNYSLLFIKLKLRNRSILTKLNGARMLLTLPSCPRSHGLKVKWIAWGVWRSRFNPSSSKMCFPSLGHKVEGTKLRTSRSKVSKMISQGRAHRRLKITGSKPGIKGQHILIFIVISFPSCS